MIKAVIFDLGGVVVDTSLIRENWIKIFKPKNSEKFWQDMNHEMVPLCKGDINEAQFWKNAARKFKVDVKSIPPNLLKKDFKKLIRLNGELLGLISQLRKNYKVAAISNIINSHSKINKSLGLYSHFHFTVLSHEVKMTKDSKEIFLHAIKELKVNPGECIFIDDIKKFVNVARSTGMKAILFRSNHQLKSELEKLLNHEENKNKNQHF